MQSYTPVIENFECLKIDPFAHKQEQWIAWNGLHVELICGGYKLKVSSYVLCFETRLRLESNHCQMQRAINAKRSFTGEFFSYRGWRQVLRGSRMFQRLVLHYTQIRKTGS